MQQKSIKKISLCYALALCTPSYAIADHHGPYLEGNIGTLFSSVYLFQKNYTGFGLLGVNANLGYQFNNYIGLETGYTGYIAAFNYYGYINNLDVAFKFNYPFQIYSNHYDIFAKLGAAYLFKGNQGIVLPMLGVGADYEITSKWAVNLQVQGVTIGRVTAGLLSLGLTYHFD